MSWQLSIIIEVPVLIFEEAKTLADTTTFRFFFLFGISTCATFCAILILFKNSITHFVPFSDILFDLIISIMSCWTIQHQPGCWEARMRSSYYNNIFHFLFINISHSSLVEISFQELTSHDYLLFILFQKRKPLFIEVWMQHLASTIWDDQSFRSKLHGLFLFWKDNVAITFIFLDDTLLFDWCG